MDLLVDSADLLFFCKTWLLQIHQILRPIVLFSYFYYQCLLLFLTSRKNRSKPKKTTLSLIYGQNSHSSKPSLASMYQKLPLRAVKLLLSTEGFYCVTAIISQPRPYPLTKTMDILYENVKCKI